MRCDRRHALSLGLAALAVACARGSGPRKRRLSIAAGLTGGVYYPYGGGIAKLVSERLPDVEVTAEATSGSVDNLKFLQAGKADLAFTLADTLEEALRGEGGFRDSGPVAARSLAALYDNYTQVVAFADAGIRGLSDLRGRVVSVGAPGSGTETIALRILEASGLDPDSALRRQALGVNDSADALKDGKLDAFFWSGGVPTGSILDLATTPGRRIVFLASDSVLPALQRRYGALYTAGTLAKGAYPGLLGDVPVVAVTNLLVVSETLEPELAYRLTRTLFENKQELETIHPEARNLTLERAVAGSPAPFHPGAIRYYKEKGAWPS